MSSYKQNIFILWLLPALLLTGCTQNAAYRTEHSLCDYHQAGDCEKHALQHYAPGQPGGYHLGFVEYDDQGQLHDRKQMHAVLNNYHSIAKIDNVLLVVFIHGWHHSAQLEDNNIMKFRELLTQLSRHESKNESPRKVLGVYIGWRGDSITIPVINDITFWERKNTAHNVGGQGVTELLLKLEEIVNVAETDKSRTQQHSRLVTIGHSFGGAVLFTSLQQILADRFIDSRPGETSSGRVGGLGDLVVLVNPAFEALRYATLYDISQDNCRNYNLEQLPKLAILTSETDRATGWAFPAGRVFSTLFETHTMVVRHDCKGPGNEKVKLEIDEGKADRNTIGHFEPYITHRLKPADTKTAINNYQKLKKSWFKQSWLESFPFENTKLVHLGKTVPTNPYLNIQVDTRIIPDHNDIWRDEIIGFLRHLILMITTMEWAEVRPSQKAGENDADS